MADQRKVALDKALKNIEKEFGKGSIMRMGDKADTQISTIPSGSLALDEALGVGGYPRGRIVEVYGPESSGKTTVALHAVAEVQKRGGTAAYIDAENALDPVYATHLGLTLMICCYHNRILVSRGFKLLMHWLRVVPLILWLLIQWLHWFHELKLKVKWVMPMWVFKRD